MKVMVVDDELYSLQKLKEQVEQFDFVSQVSAFDNPYHALEAVSQLEIDVAILDIEMFGLNGIELAKQCKFYRPEIKIIFLTGYSDYAVNAFKIRASGYLLKPTSLEEIKVELLHAGDIPSPQMHISIQTFGNFEVFVDGVPVHFERAKTKELLAYLVSRKGAYASVEELLSILYEDKPVTMSSKSQLRNLIASLMKTLKAWGIEDLVLKKRGLLALNTNCCSCDYYSFLKGDVMAINSFMGEFMSNYEWAEFITGYLEQSRNGSM